MTNIRESYKKLKTLLQSGTGTAEQIKNEYLIFSNARNILDKRITDEPCEKTRIQIRI